MYYLQSCRAWYLQSWHQTCEDRGYSWFRRSTPGSCCSGCPSWFADCAPLPERYTSSPLSSWMMRHTQHKNTPGTLTLKRLGHFFQNVILFSKLLHHKCNIFIWNWSNIMNVSSALWMLMAWCISTRASVATVLTMQPCVSRCLRVNTEAETIWPTFSRRHFQMHFLEWRCLNLN